MCRLLKIVGAAFSWFVLSVQKIMVAWWIHIDNPISGAKVRERELSTERTSLKFEIVSKWLKWPVGEMIWDDWSLLGIWEWGVKWLISYKGSFGNRESLDPSISILITPSHMPLYTSHVGIKITYIYIYSPQNKKYAEMIECDKWAPLLATRSINSFQIKKAVSINDGLLNWPSTHWKIKSQIPFRFKRLLCLLSFLDP